ncbi:zinc finger BED domain-containing protein 5-like [Erpetoichthys calabaricus]|uniref:zinc finger BED domain-containing protein 5-like n=1 Tax=Erpetoichthys calabaricus TaxID=27687 RepID=UPI0010A073EE|nr:zinc finger BED domain-containing protein 5-like [Erpetoichthys calabaricus]
MDQWLKSGFLPMKRRKPDQEEMQECCQEDGACQQEIEGQRESDVDGYSNNSHVAETESGAANKSALRVSQKHGNKRKKVVRKYDEKYIDYGFTCIDDENEPKPQCILCYEVLSNECMKPAKLKRHIQTKHGAVQEKPREYFLRKLSELKGGKKIMKKATSINMKALEASYVVSNLIAKAGKPHTIGEELILPAAKQLVTIMCGEKIASELNVVRLSNDTVSLRISDMANDVQQTLVHRVKNSKFYSLQLDESTDIASQANFLMYVRYIWNEKVLEELLFCRPLPSNTTAELVFGVLSSFVNENGIPWEKRAGICTDGARAMSGINSGLISRVKEIAPDVWIHCSIHREALATKKMPPRLKNVLDTAVKVVNFIKARPLQSRLCHIICQEMGSTHLQLLLHTEVRWLSRGKVLTRLFELREEVRIFFTDHPFQHRASLDDPAWISLLACLADIISRLNDLNRGLQGNVTIYDVHDKIA